MRYSDEFRHRLVEEVLPPKNRSVEEVCEKHGISPWTLYRGKKAVKNGTLGQGALKPSDRPLAEKLSLLLEGTRLAEGRRGYACCIDAFIMHSRRSPDPLSGCLSRSQAMRRKCPNKKDLQA